MYMPPYCVMFVEDASQNLGVVRMCVDPPKKFSGYAKELKLCRISKYAMVISWNNIYACWGDMRMHMCARTQTEHMFIFLFCLSLF
jgi:hypothetical protein